MEGSGILYLSGIRRGVGWFGVTIGIGWEMETGRVEIEVLERCTGILCGRKAIKDKGKE